MSNVTGTLYRLLFVLVAAIGLNACAAFQGQLFDTSFWASSPFKQNDEAELGIAELAKGNYVTAESHFQKALKRNGKDIHALLGAGILYQNTGQLTKAREMYEAVLAIRPDESQQFVVWNSITTRPASQIASVNLSLLDSRGLTSAMGSIAAGQGVTPPYAAPTGVFAAPTGSAMLGRPPARPYQPPAPAPAPAPVPGGPQAVIGKFADADANIVSRFATTRALRDQGLITQQEFASRRRANIGALLPLTSPPPSAGLDRPVPTTEQISGRLRAIGRALEMRAISVTQHSAERNMILDALMPSAPVVVENPGAPPSGLMQAADAVRRLEQLRDGGYITSDEYAKERQAIEGAMQPAPPKMAPVAMAPTPDKPRAKASSGSRPAVHLASYRTRKNANKGWAKIKRANKKLLGGLEHEILRVNLGKKGTYYRVKAGPFKSAKAAKQICRKLKRRRQFCEPTVMEGG